MSVTLQPRPGSVANVAGTVPESPVENVESPRRRLLAIGIVLFVSFAHFIVSSAYYLMGEMSANVPPRQARLLGGLIAEAGSLAVLWYVLSGQRRNWKNIGWKLKWMDAPRALGLVFGAILASYAIMIPAELFFHAYSGHSLTPKSMHGLLGEISVLSVAFVCLNPFFEELIVRGYLMTEIMELGGNGVLAIVVSVAVQMSYHLYQGFTNGIALTTIFTVFSIYFWRSRRIVPLVFAHFC